ncbi:choline dehydrogenase [Aeromicrobium sp. Root495]|uniref:GMC family oxidoreductase n=1 Tax=Aeromicrobium sp. Root495 TaxID=1736550 RepID=UPI0006FE6343|nr:GMC family oxidoreductase N-terminal domain-containing protein [Aeromicrobium sp. Root495]KQY58262.1 choline dehydrogenase [Aeromicrobium sp. Root495]
MAKRSTPSTEADYVVVGSGSSGAAVAARLAQSGASVIMLEAGRSDDKGLHGYFTKKPGMVAPMHFEEKLEKGFDWGYKSVPQENAGGREMLVTRGKVMGGSSSVNGMVYVRGNRANYDSWAAEGNTGWSADEVNAAYKRSEDFEDGENAYRGSGGPIKVSRSTITQEGTRQFIEATSETLGVKINDDYNGAEQEGISVMQENVRDGIRYSSTRGYVHDLKPRTLEVQTQVLATKIVIENGRATGVEILDQGKRTPGRRTIRANREVIVSGGFVNSPQLLMLSGIGPADHLRSLGIDCIADLPVGDNLHDHLFHPLSFRMSTITHKSTPLFFLQGLAKNAFGKDTFLNHSIFESVGFVRSSMATDVPDIQLHAIPWAYPDPGAGYHGKAKPAAHPTLGVFSTLIYPKSRGTLRLASADPTAAPLIDYGYLDEPDDLKVLAEGTEMIRAIMSHSSFGGSVKEESYPGKAVTKDNPEEIRRRAVSVMHAVGTCRMGVDERAVVNPDLTVRGIDGLRVVDASIMPTITGGNTNAPCYMIGERAADFILGNA